ncbi:MAG: hypothetical protein G8345_08250 [Magnetococcales bacterium]|nr:hypothetical protein [Magnetococcales bacterium]
MPDILDSLQTSNSLSTDGSPVTSTVDSSGDQDWWRVLLSANTSYLFSMGAANASSLDTYLRLLDNSGSQITYDDDSGDGYNSLISYTPTSSGTYYISAQGYSSSTGDYTLSVNNNGSEIPASTDTTNALTINGEAATSTIGTSGDQDWWRTVLSAGTSYTIQLNANASSLDAYLRLLDSSGSVITYDDDSGEGLNSLINFTPTYDGTYYVSAQGYGSSSGSYSLQINSTSDNTNNNDDLPANTSTSGRLTINSSPASGTIELSADQDWWQVVLNSGVAYRIQQNGTSGSTLDTYLRLLDGSGSQLTYDDDSGDFLNSLINYTPSIAGTYFVSAGGYQTSTGSYTLSISTQEENPSLEDQPATTSTSFTLTVNGSPTNSSVDIAGDQDWWRVELNSGTTYTFLQGAASSSHLDSYLRLLDNSGTQLAYDDDSGAFFNSRLVYTPSASGTYYLSAQGYASSTGNYTLSFCDNSSTQDDISASTSTTATLTVNAAPQTSSIDGPQDQDWWQMQLSAGVTYSFVQNTTTNSTLDPFLRLLNSSGTELALNDDGGGYPNALLLYTPTSSGTYYLSAQGYGSTSGGYAISVVQPSSILQQANGIFNALSGGGFMPGGAEDNVYMIDDPNDQVDERGQNSLDMVFAWRSFTLGDQLEELRLLGNNSLDGYGNNLNNIISGNMAANALYGGGGNDFLFGGAGEDSLFGGLGDDTVYLGSNQNQIIEKAGQGIDTLCGRFSLVLPENMENLTLSSPNFPTLGRFNRLRNLSGLLDATNQARFAEGNELDNTLTGNCYSNTLIGNAGNDTLIGGIGNDTLVGGSGADSFRFNFPQEGLDVIDDFAKSEGDRLEFSLPAFGEMSAGVLEESRFVSNETGEATTAEQRFIFNTADSTLLFDPDGSGIRSAIALVVLDQITLNANDITLVAV